MNNLRKRFERFCFKHRDKGIPNLMLYIVLGNALVYLMSMLNNSYVLYDVLCFDRELILQGQIWRLISFIFTSFENSSGIFLLAISLFCYYSLGRAMESIWGTFRFNLFYFSGVVLMDIFAMCLGGILVQSGHYLYDCSSLYRSMGAYLNMSLFLGFATLNPNAQFLLFFIIPVKAWIFALVDLGITIYQVISMSTPLNLFPHSLFPLVAIANYFLFFGKDVLNVFPVSWRTNIARLFRKKPQQQGPKVIQFPGAGSHQPSQPKAQTPYTHRCTVCGRTDVSNPELEFRYCSRCNGYHCYCIEHINNHTHAE